VKKLLLILLTLLVVVLVPASCSKQETATTPPPTSKPTSSPTMATTASGPQSGGVLTIIDVEFISSPIGYLREVTYNASPFILPCIESFFNFDNQNNAIPYLATNWEFSSDYTSLTFHLRKNVKFHDGSDFNAEVAKWNMDQMIESKDSAVNAWESVEVVDDYTVRINLKGFDSLIMYNIPHATQIISKASFEKNGVEYARWNAVGTGPFKQKEFIRDQSIEWERFDGYWGGKPYLDGVKFIYVKDSTTAELALEGGQANGLHIMGGAHLSAYRLAPKGFQIILPPSFFATLYFDTKSPDSIYANQKVREAIEYAIDRDKIAKTVGFGYWFPMNQCAAPCENGYIPNFTGREYNPEKAKELLNEAGYPDGFKTTIYVPAHLSGDHMVAIQNYLAAIKIDASIEVITSARWMELQYGPGGFTDILYSPSGASDVDSTSPLNRSYGPTANVRLSNLPPPGMKDLVVKMLAEPDPAKRADMAKQATQLVYDYCTKIALWNQPAMYAFDNKVHDTGITEWYLPFQFNWTKVWMSK
jgi:peptide/nickel transport system substrate-binding protein